MFKFRKARSDVLNELDEYLQLNSGELVLWLEREARNFGEFSYEELAALIASGDTSLINWQSRYAQLVNDKFNPAWLAAIQAGSFASTRGRITIDDSDFRVKEFLRTRGAEFVTQLSDESKRAVAAIILRGQSENLRPLDIAKLIRPLIGLNARQADANLNYRAQVLNKLIDAGLSPSQAAIRADKSAAAFAAKQHKYRAETIVHTELARAYNQGAFDGVKAAVDAKLMPHCEMIWSTAGTNRVCSRCLELKDVVVGRTDEVGVQIPPLHPRCRCVIVYRESSKPATSRPLTVPSGLPWRRQQHFSSSDENIQATNPRFADGLPFQINCQKCVVAYEMRMRGYDVVARPTYNLATDKFANGWNNAFENVVWLNFPKGSGKTQIIEHVTNWGDGARGEVFVAWDEMNAHVFIAENRNGVVHFLDPQTGDIDVEHYFDGVVDGMTKLARIDNLDPNESLVKKFCVEVKHAHFRRSRRNCRKRTSVVAEIVRRIRRGARQIRFLCAPPL